MSVSVFPNLSPKRCGVFKAVLLWPWSWVVSDFDAVSGKEIRIRLSTWRGKVYVLQVWTKEAR